MNLLNKARKFPDSPGVYIFLGKNKKILYAGRSVSLKKRILNYFRSDIDARIREMVSLARNLKYKKTDTLLEAIILEANVIKKYWPKYNVKDKDNRSFIYLVIPKEDYPRPIIIRQKELVRVPKTWHLFGPYQSASLLESALRIIRRIFPYSTCKPFLGKPCFDYQIGLCPGICVGKISKKEYQNNIRNLEMILAGQKERLFKKLRKENPNAIKALKQIQDVSLMKKEELKKPEDEMRIEAYDISHLTGKETYGAMAVFENGKANTNEYRLFKIKNAPANDDLRALEEMIERRFKHKEWQYPDFILIDGGKPQIDFISKIFKRIHISIPMAGISKFGGDKLVYKAKEKIFVKKLAEGLKNTLLSVRDEAHRFSLKSSRRNRAAKLK